MKAARAAVRDREFWTEPTHSLAIRARFVEKPRADAGMTARSRGVPRIDEARPFTAFARRCAGVAQLPPDDARRSTDVAHPLAATLVRQPTSFVRPRLKARRSADVA